MNQLRSQACRAARIQALIWTVCAAVLLTAMGMLSQLRPFGWGAELLWTVGLCLLGGAAAGASFMISGWCCTAGQIRSISPEKMTRTYARCSAEDIALRLYNIWRFRFFGLRRYCGAMQEDLLIQKLEEGCAPRDIFMDEPHS